MVSRHYTSDRRSIASIKVIVRQRVGRKETSLRFGFSLETTGRLMELDSRDGKLRVFYGDRLVILLSEVRQLSALGYEIPQKIVKCAEMGKKFYQYGVELQAVGDSMKRDTQSFMGTAGRAFLQHHRLGNDSESTADDARPSEEFRASRSRRQRLE